VTVRTLEALARLCEARARADLRHSATRDDALDVVALMKEALPDTFTGEPLPGAYSCGAGGGSSSLQGEPRRFLAALAAEARTKDGGYLSYAECVAVADRIGLNVPDVLALVERLNYDGELLKHGRLYTVTGVKPAAADVEQEEGLSPTERAQRRGWSSR
jgi:DNA replicative helicase MCM subunit Mcm2 (Cdc46/Mcm family)